MAEHILIAGANGIIGKELVRVLLEKEVCVRVGVRNLERAAALNMRECPVVIFDYEKPQTFKSAFEGIERFFLATPLRQPQVDKLIIPVLAAAKKMGVSHIVTLGSVGVEQDGGSPLSIAEKCVQHSGIDYTILRPNLFMQNILNISSAIQKSNQLRLPAGSALISFVDARDIARAVAQILIDSSHKNHIYILTGRESVNLFQVAHILSKVTTRTITYIPISHSEAYQEFINAGLAESSAGFINGLFEIARQGWCEEVRPDLKEILRHDPTSFEQFAWDYKDNW